MLDRLGAVVTAGRSTAGGRIRRIAANDARNDAALMTSAHSTPNANSNGAASGGPMTKAVL